MSYAIEFIREAGCGPVGGVVRRYVAQFDDLAAAERYGHAHMRSVNRADEADGFRIYVGGVLRRSVSMRID